MGVIQDLTKKIEDLKRDNRILIWLLVISVGLNVLAIAGLTPFLNGMFQQEKDIRYAYERGLFSGCVIALADDIEAVYYEPIENLESVCLGVLEYADEKDWYSWDAKIDN